MTHRYYSTKYIFLLVTVIKNLSKIVMQWYNSPKLIWMKQNISFACSNYQSNWQLIDNFCLHLSELSRIETWRKRIVNGLMTTELWAVWSGSTCLPICKNRFEKFARIFSRRHKQTTFSDSGFLGILRVNYALDKRGVLINIFHISPWTSMLRVLLKSASPTTFFLPKSVDIFLIFAQKHMLFVLIASYLVRHFYVFVEK